MRTMHLVTKRRKNIETKRKPRYIETTNERKKGKTIAKKEKKNTNRSKKTKSRKKNNGNK